MGREPFPRRRIAAFAASACAAAVLVAGAGASVRTPAGPRAVVASSGAAAPQLLLHRLHHATAASRPVRFTIALNPANLAELQRKAMTGAFHEGTYLSVAGFADRYGQPAALVDEYTAYLESKGLSVNAFPDRLALSVSGTTAQVNAAFRVRLQDVRMPGVAGVRPQTVHVANTRLTLPADLAAATLGIVGLSGYTSAFRSREVRPPHYLHRPQGARPAAGARTPAGFLARYHGMGLLRDGRSGQGETIGIVTMASFRPADAYTFWKRYTSTLTGRITVTSVDGGPGAPSRFAGSDETALDVEQSGAVAPRAHIDVYQAPNTAAGFLDAWLTAVNTNAAGSLTTSWGQSETAFRVLIALGVYPRSIAAIDDIPFLEAAAQGQAAFDASGDSGAYEAWSDVETTRPDVDAGAASRFITATGGTTPNFAQSTRLPDHKRLLLVVAHERAWAWDYLVPAWRQLNAATGAQRTRLQWLESVAATGTGGGHSIFAPMPSYQSAFPNIRRYAAVGYFTPVHYTSRPHGVPKLPFRLPVGARARVAPGVSLGTMAASHRLVPDLSAVADPNTGYSVYSSVGGEGWSVAGGTSFVAPQMAGVSALIQAQAGHRVGFWNPTIYGLAAGAGSPFRPLDAGSTQAQTRIRHTPEGPVINARGNNNLRWSGRAGTRYNMATGLGVPDLTALGSAFAATH